MTYEGWANYVLLGMLVCGLIMKSHMYRAAVEFMADYKGERPYIDFCKDSGLDVQKTPDGIMWLSNLLDYTSLDEMMWEMAPEGARHVQ